MPLKIALIGSGAIGLICFRRLGIPALLWIAVSGTTTSYAQQHTLSAPYIDPRYLTDVPFGAHSHWLQPWRAYQETIPAQRFLDAQGVVLEGDDGIDFDLICRMLAKNGIRNARIEIGWNSIDWDQESRITNLDTLRKRLLACQKNHLRPLILLNANSGAPGPTRFFDRVLGAPAHKGDRQVELTDVQNLVVGYSGFRNLTDNRASEVMITAIQGATVTLSKPLPKDLGAKGAKVGMTTLKYRPFGSLLQTESVLRDMGPITTPIGHTMHGRDARVVDGKVAPCPLWFTEIGFAPNENGIPDRIAGLAMKAKAAARYECFYIGKGLERIYFYSSCSGDGSLGVVQDNFVAYAKTHATFPTDDSPYTSPMLRVLGRLTAAMRDGVDPNLKQPRALTVASISESHDHTQFVGGGFGVSPPLYNRDVFAVLPFQVNAHKFILPYYVITRDVTKTLPPEQYTVSLKGLHGKGATVRAYDPIEDKTVPVTVRNSDATTLTVTLTARDYPCLLIVQEH